jgi:hypothetical protein
LYERRELLAWLEEAMRLRAYAGVELEAMSEDESKGLKLVGAA